jgi:hypothetical protein
MLQQIERGHAPVANWAQIAAAARKKAAAGLDLLAHAPCGRLISPLLAGARASLATSTRELPPPPPPPPSARVVLVVVDRRSEASVFGAVFLLYGSLWCGGGGVWWVGIDRTGCGADALEGSVAIADNSWAVLLGVYVAPVVGPHCPSNYRLFRQAEKL